MNRSKLLVTLLGVSLGYFVGISQLYGQKAAAAPSTPTVNVKVINTESEPVKVAGTVNVGNSLDGPLKVRDADNGQQPFQRSAPLSLSVGTSLSFLGAFAVPAGKRLVIESVSVRVDLDSADSPDSIGLQTTAAGFNNLHYILVSKQGSSSNGRSTYVGTHSFRVYADPETVIGLLVARNNSGATAIATLTVSGYLVDVP